MNNDTVGSRASLIPQDATDLEAPLCYSALAWYILAHVVTIALAVPFFSQAGFTVAAYFHLFFGGAITLGVHRYFSHDTFQAPRWLRFYLALMYTLSFDRCGQGLISWAAAHKFHHAYSDRDLDPHSPAHGFWHSFCGHHLFRRRDLFEFDKYKRYCPELASDPMLVWFDRQRNIWGLQFLLIAVMFVAGGLWGAAGAGFDLWMATSFVVWTVFVRFVFSQTLHSLLDTLNHGTPPMHKLPDTYGTNTRSKNSMVLWPMHLGNEMWHNVHHAFPNHANNGARWYRWDLDSLFMKGLESCRVIRGCRWLTEDDLNRRRSRAIEKQSAPDGPLPSDRTPKAAGTPTDNTANGTNARQNSAA